MPAFSEIIGHQANIATLIQAVQADKVAHAYLFAGAAGVGKQSTAQAFAQGLLCAQPLAGQGCRQCKSCLQFKGGNHPDFYILAPSGATIKIEQIRQLQKHVNYRSYQGGRKVYLIQQCDTMTADAANSFLKTLEEPPPGCVFILLSSRPHALLTTISSRCQQYWFKPMAVAEIIEGLRQNDTINPAQHPMLAAMAGGSLGRALQLAQGDIDASRQQAMAVFTILQQHDLVALLQAGAELASHRPAVLEWVTLLQQWLRDILVWQLTGRETLLINLDLATELAVAAAGYSEAQVLGMMEETMKAKTRLEANGNVRLVVEVLLLQLAQEAAKGGKR